MSGKKTHYLLKCTILILLFPILYPQPFLYRKTYNNLSSIKSFQSTFFNEISLDAIACRSIYNNSYLNRIQEIEGQYHVRILKISKNSSNIKDMGRLKRKNVIISKEGRKKKPVVVVDGHSWDINTCKEIIKENMYDGDALFILGCYYLLTGDTEEAISMFFNPETSNYKVFGIADVYNWFGYAYYKLGCKAKIKRKSKEYFNYLGKEQEIYLSSKEITNEDDRFFFRYLYTLTFIDLGLYLETVENKIEVNLPNSVVITGAREAFEYASHLLSAFKKPNKWIHEKRSFVYYKLGNREKAIHEKKLQGENVKTSLYEKKRAPVREKILKELNNRKIIPSAFELKYKQALRYKHSTFNVKGEDVLKPLIKHFCKNITWKIVNEHPESKLLTEENKKLLFNEIKIVVTEKVLDTLKIFETDYVWNFINNLSKGKKYKQALSEIIKNEHLLKNSKKNDELARLKKSLPESVKQLDKAIKRKKTVKKTVKKTQKKKNIEPETKIIVKSISKKTSEETKKSEIPVYLRIGKSIDNLIEKGDYIGAYRGINAYRNILTEHLTAEKVDRSVKELEKLIQKQYGIDKLKELKNELK